MEDHGPLMLYKIFMKLSPSTNVEIDVLTARLKKIWLSHHGQDVMSMLDAMDLLYNKMEEINVPVARYKNVFFAALLSGTIVEFKQTIQFQNNNYNIVQKELMQSTSRRLLSQNLSTPLGMKPQPLPQIFLQQPRPPSSQVLSKQSVLILLRRILL